MIRSILARISDKFLDRYLNKKICICPCFYISLLFFDDFKNKFDSLQKLKKEDCFANIKILPRYILLHHPCATIIIVITSSNVLNYLTAFMYFLHKYTLTCVLTHTHESYTLTHSKLNHQYIYTTPPIIA